MYLFNDYYVALTFILAYAFCVIGGIVMFFQEIKHYKKSLKKGLWVIRITSKCPCFFTGDFDNGDPDRTHIIENAEFYKNKQEAEKICEKLTELYPYREFKAEQIK